MFDEPAAAAAAAAAASIYLGARDAEANLERWVSNDLAC
jgi:hypothetical protein